MKTPMKIVLQLVASAAVLIPSAAYGQAASAPAEPPRALVSLYHAAPGHQEALIRWLADQERAAAAAGIPPAQLYVHTDGDSWDFVLIAPVTTEAQDAALDAAAKKLGLPAGPRAGLEFRKHIQTHTDTFTIGPITVSDYLARLGPAR
jgi:hypothetical protein